MEARIISGAFDSDCTILFLYFIETYGICNSVDLSISRSSFCYTFVITVLKQNVGVVRWVAVVIGFIGIILVLNPKGDFFSLFSILPLCSAFCYASTSVTAPIFKESIPTPVVNMYTLIGALIGSLFMVIITNSFVKVENVFDHNL